MRLGLRVQGDETPKMAVVARGFEASYQSRKTVTKHDCSQD